MSKEAPEVHAAAVALDARIQTLEMLIGHLLKQLGSKATSAAIQQIEKGAGSNDPPEAREAILQTLQRVQSVSED